MTTPILTQETLKEHVLYDPITGIWKWKIAMSNRVRVGDAITNTDAKGYRVIVIKGFRYRACRLAFLYMEGVLPTSYVKHRDKNKLNDAWDNLSKERMKKIRITSVHTGTGIKGLSLNKKSNKYQCRIMRNRETYYESFNLEDRDKAVKWLEDMRKELESKEECEGLAA